MSDKQKEKKSSSFIMIALVLGGLAFLSSKFMTSPGASQAEASAALKFEPVPDKAVVYVFRKTSAGGMHTFRTFRLYLEGPLGDIGNGTFLRTIVSPGSRKVQLTNVRNVELDSLQISAETNMIYYIELLLSDPITGKPSLKQADAEAAKGKIVQCKMLVGGSN